MKKRGYLERETDMRQIRDTSILEIDITNACIIVQTVPGFAGIIRKHILWILKPSGVRWIPWLDTKGL